MRAITKVIGAAMLMVLGTALQAHALAITPSTGILGNTRIEGATNSQAAINADLAALGIPTTELYKENVGDGFDTGAFGPSYTTAFLATPSDPSGATITYVATQPVITATYNPVWLLVKDGNTAPQYYLFNVSALGWNGTEQLVLSNFWPQQGAISHVSFYGARSTQVPDGGMTVSLLGSALVGLGLLRRKFSA